MDYKEQFSDPRWQKRRLEILQRDGFMCQKCGDNKTTLHVHHKFYTDGKCVWEYGDAALITLCSECHELEEKLIKDNGALLIKTLRESEITPDDWMTLAGGIHHLKCIDEPELVAHAYAYAFKTPSVQKIILDRYFKFIAKNRGCRK